MQIGAIEAGGTKMVCAVGNEKGEIHERIVFPTKTPDKTMPEIIKWFISRDIKALGIGCFGPINLDTKSHTYGHIMTTPKVFWQGFDIVGYFKRTFAAYNKKNLPIGFDTDVNASCLGEAEWGSTKDVDSSIYITVGTGIGAGIISENRLIHGMLHPEAGHILIERAASDKFQGVCSYHSGEKYCLEGLASGPAIFERWGKEASELTDNNEVWELEAYYLSLALVNYILILSPKRIVLGGGVMKQKQLYPLIREKTMALLNGYIPLPDPETYIVPPALGDDQGLMGAIKLALIAYEAG